MAAHTQVIYDTLMTLAIEMERARPLQPQQAVIDAIQTLRDEMRNGFNAIQTLRDEMHDGFNAIQTLRDEMRNGFNHLHEEIQQVRADVTTLSTRMAGFEDMMIKRMDASGSSRRTCLPQS